MKRIAAVVCAFAVLAGCRGSTGTLPLEARSAGAVKSVRDGSVATVHFNFTVPRGRTQSARRAHYVSPNTQSMTVAVNGGTPQPIGLTPATDPNCSGTTPPIVCTNLSVIAPAGSDTFTFKIYKEALVSGQEPPNPTLLATYTTPAPITIVEGASNQLGNFVLNGVPAAAALTPGTLVAPADGRVHSFDLAVTVRDASGATIVAPGTFASPIALHVGNDPHAALSVTPQTISAPSSTGTTHVKVTYDASKTLVSGIISVVLGSVSPPTYVNPLVYKLDSDAPLVVGGSKRKITVSEARYAGAFTVSVGGTAVSATCKPESCTPASAGGAITVEVAGNEAGSADVSIADANGVSATVPFTVISELEFHYTGARQIFVVPSGISTIHVYAYGAQGGGAKNLLGGRGGRTIADIAVRSGEELGIYVGGKGHDERDCKGGSGGFNGGGRGGDANSYPKCNGNRLGGGGGGGASDIRRFNEKAYDILVIAGGGGGAAGANGGAGGARDGGGNKWCTGGRAGTTTRGGAAGICTVDILQPGTDGTRGTGGNGGAGDSSAGAGGGAGYYGGGGTPGTAKNHPSGGGGGGSSFAESTAINVVYAIGIRLDDGLITIAW